MPPFLGKKSAGAYDIVGISSKGFDSRDSDPHRASSSRTTVAVVVMRVEERKSGRRRRGVGGKEGVLITSISGSKRPEPHGSAEYGIPNSQGTASFLLSDPLKEKKERRTRS